MLCLDGIVYTHRTYGGRVLQLFFQHSFKYYVIHEVNNIKQEFNVYYVTRVCDRLVTVKR